MYCNCNKKIDTVLKGETFEIDNKSKYFPAALKEISDCPKKLYLIGNFSALTEGLAVVGTRRPTPYGLSVARHFSYIAAQKGITIISGGAYGCDSAAHKGALDAQGKTVVFLGGGCNYIYPAKNIGLFQEIIVNNGCIVSELSWERKALPYTFIKRNRLIAGLAKATLITEASIPSGAFSTVDFALKYNKEVLVVPGAITSEKSIGCNKLIFDGAFPVIDDDTFNDYLFSIFGILKSTKSRLCNSNMDMLKNNEVIKAILSQPTSYEDLLEIARKNWGENNLIVKLSILLAEAESNKIICKYNNGMYSAYLN